MDTHAAIAFLRLSTFAAAAADMTASSVARADDGRSPHGVELGLRTGYAVSVGKLSSVPGGPAAVPPSVGLVVIDDMSGIYPHRVPIMVDAGYRIDPHLYVGAFFMYGFLSCTTCDVAREVELGAEAHLHFAPDRTLDPWVGVGAGYEWVTSSATVPGRPMTFPSVAPPVTVDTSVNGWQFANVQVGVDYKVSPDLGLGPFAMLSLGEYSVTDADKAVHGWVTFGVRGAYSLGP